MAGRLEGRTAVVTGGASGIGRAAVLRFLAEGARVVVADLNEATGKETLELAAQAGYGAGARFVRTDVSQESDVEAAVQLCTREFGRLDCIFNNAGIGGAFGSIADMSVEDWDFTFGVLARGVFLGIKHATRVMRAQGEGGSIVNTASVAGMGGGAGPLAYSSAKGAVINLTRAAARELAPDRIRVNAICPGAILTPLLHRGNADAVSGLLRQMQPWPDIGQPEHVASAALFLASDDAQFITGETLVVDGGLMAASPVIRLGGGDGASRLSGLRGVDHGSTGRPPEIRRS
jgi:NAD(P)-dependent dehydrogenase (short-subunit alcohol dehydrogenase family)